MGTSQNGRLRRAALLCCGGAGGRGESGGRGGSEAPAEMVAELPYCAVVGHGGGGLFEGGSRGRGVVRSPTQVKQ